MDAEQRAAELFDAENPIDVKKAGVNAALMRAAAIRAITRSLTQAQPGWRVVPVEATPEMIAADLALDIDATPAESWAAMLAAAPAAQVGEG